MAFGSFQDLCGWVNDTNCPLFPIRSLKGSPELCETWISSSIVNGPVGCSLSLSENSGGRNSCQIWVQIILPHLAYFSGMKPLGHLIPYFASSLPLFRVISASSFRGGGRENQPVSPLALAPLFQTSLILMAGTPTFVLRVLALREQILSPVIVLKRVSERCFKESIWS